jgi:hypothetical protein
VKSRYTHSKAIVLNRQDWRSWAEGGLERLEPAHGAMVGQGWGRGWGLRAL